MRGFVMGLLVGLCSLSLVAQPAPQQRRPRPMPRSAPNTFMAESAVKQAMEQLVAVKKAYERDLEVLRRLNEADDALADDMQPHNAIQKAYEEVDAAKGLVADPVTREGIVKSFHDLESARRSPGAADFGRLRSVLRTEAIGPAGRVVARNGAALQDELLAWIKVQEMISGHLRAMSEIAAESLRAAQ